ncbi:MAG TPA: RT0821/Lpp0805 family surface protein [Burkholderiales bacterium]|nr:RT0821/Lpp0805 family surface protein [Burkholderiales bacterium]
MKRTLGFLFVLATSAAIAAPPDHAPAHGWRKKNDPNYHGYTGKKWKKDYGVLEGRCNTAAVGAVVGGVAGGVIGAKVSSKEDRPVAIILGTAIGAVIGHTVGKELDNADRGCMGHALELAGNKHTVAWTNKQTGVSYRLTPTRGFNEGNVPCREFTTVVSTGKKKKESVSGVACRRGDGEWVFRS